MWGGTEQIKTEAPKAETAEAKAARETKEFGDNLNKVKDFLAAPANKTEEQEKQISWLLDSNFQKWLSTMDCNDVKTINDTVNGVLKDTSLNNWEKTVLVNIQTLLTPLITEDKAVANFEKDASGKVIASWTEKINYNIDIKKWGDFLKKSATKLSTPEYNELPGKPEILNALQNPTKENIISLQTFLYDNLPADDQAAFKKENQKKGAWDGMYGINTDAALNNHLQAFIDFQNTKKTAAEKNLPTAKAAADALAKTNDEIHNKVEETKDNQAALAILNSKITYAHPERADKTIKIADDMKTINYRWAVFNIPPKTLVAINNAKTTWWMSFKPENFITFLDPTESKSFTDRKGEKDKELDAKIMTYDEKTNNYVYGGKYISRDAIGTGGGQMTLETFQTEVDKMNMNNSNESATTTKRTSADGDVITKIKDFQYGNGYKIKTTTLDDKTQNVATTKVEVKRGDKEKTVTKTFDAQGRTDTFTKVKTNGDVKKEKIRTYDDEWRVIDFTKNIEKKDSFKERATTKEMNIDNEATNTIKATSSDVLTALTLHNRKASKETIDLNIWLTKLNIPKTMEEQNSILKNYDIVRTWDKINISLKTWWIALDQPTFTSTFENLLKTANIATLDMKDYAMNGNKKDTVKSVTDYSFVVGEDTTKTETPITKTETWSNHVDIKEIWTQEIQQLKENFKNLWFETKNNALPLSFVYTGKNMEKDLGPIVGKSMDYNIAKTMAQTNLQLNVLKALNINKATMSIYPTDEKTIKPKNKDDSYMVYNTNFIINSITI